LFIHIYKEKISIVRLSEAEALLAAAFGILDFKKLRFGIYKELFPAIRFNLLLFKEKSKRISASIGARAPVFRGGLKGKRAGFGRGRRKSLAPQRLCGIENGRCRLLKTWNFFKKWA
jgi:hypothetical protein